MDYVFAVEVTHTSHNLLEVLRNLVLLKIVVFYNFLKTTAWCKLHEEVKFFWVFVAWVVLYNVEVIQVEESFYFFLDFINVIFVDLVSILKPF